MELFNDYLNYIFNEKKGAAVGRRKKPDDGGIESSHAELEIEMDCDKDGKVLPFAELRSELFHPTRVDIR